MVSKFGQGWSPDGPTLDQLVQLIQKSLDPRCSNEENREISMKVDEFSRNESFVRYLAFIFAECQDKGASVELRYMASLILIKALRIGLKQNIVTADGLVQVKASALHMLSDENMQIRKASCNLVPTIVAYSELRQWPELLNFLNQTLQQGENTVIFGECLQILENLCEESGPQMVQMTNGRQPLQVFFPFMMKCFGHENPKYRSQVLRCLNYLMSLEDLPAVISSHAEDLLQGLSMLAKDGNEVVRKEVCLGLTLLTGWRMDVVAPHIGDIVQFMLVTLNEAPESVAFEACEFFSQICENVGIAENALTPCLPQLFQGLLRRMPFSEEELILFGTDEELDTSIADRQEDIKPSLHGQQQLHHGATHVSRQKLEDGTGNDADEEDNNDDDDDDNDDDDDEEEEFESVWTIRKAADCALMEIAKVIPASTSLPILLPMLQQSLEASNPWKVREVGVYALGSLASAYSEALHEHLPGLIPYLMQQTQPNQVTPIRYIAYWAISQYSEWICNVYSTGQPGDQLAKEVIVLATRGTGDRNKKIQHVACSCLADFTEHAQNIMDPFCADVVHVLMQSYEIYQTKNKKHMTDVIRTLYTYVPNAMSKADIAAKVIPPLWRDFEALKDGDTLVLSYLSMFGGIVQTLGPAFGTYAKHLYNRCIHFIEESLTMIMASVDFGIDPYDADREFLFAALEILSSFAEGLMENLVHVMDVQSFLRLYVEVLKDEHDVTREIAFGLLGDLARAIPVQIAPIIPSCFDLMSRYIYPPCEENIHITGNCVWAIGEITNQLKGETRQFLAKDALVDKIVLLIQDHNMETSVKFNASITLGRIAIQCPDLVGPHLNTIGGDWASNFRMIRNVGDDISDREKMDCLNGLLNAVHNNPAGMKDGFNYLCVALLSIKNYTPELLQNCATILETVKQALMKNGSWQATVTSVTPQVLKELQNRHLLNP